MSEQSGVFDWIEFPEGRARFCGGVRGADQAGHETFAVEIAGESYYGEISSVWPDDSHFNLRIDSFGHSRMENVGMPVREGNPFIEKFLSADVELIKSLVLKLIQSFRYPWNLQ
ncbi:hypothetical protein [Frateuria sp.]|uniref:hypothetical protein n=1 Tax=Frateuria sp. TaxID=2211372 RepID=UPI003F7CE05B